MKQGREGAPHDGTQGHGSQHEAVPLKPRAFAILRYLVEHPQRLVTKTELLALWGDVHVSDSVLKTHLRDIRRALGDDVHAPRYIETAHRRGYRFICPITRAPAVSGADPTFADAATAGAAPLEADAPRSALPSVSARAGRRAGDVFFASEQRDGDIEGGVSVADGEGLDASRWRDRAAPGRGRPGRDPPGAEKPAAENLTSTTRRQRKQPWRRPPFCGAYGGAARAVRGLRSSRKGPARGVAGRRGRGHREVQPGGRVREPTGAGVVHDRLG